MENRVGLPVVKCFLRFFLAVGLTAFFGCEKASPPKVKDMSIGEVKVAENGKGGRTISIPIATRPGLAIDVREIKVMVNVYVQKPSGQVVLSSTRITLQWKTPPVDWKAGETEVLDVTSPPIPPEEGTYHGYLVGVYLKDVLADSRSEPESLAEKFPLPEKY